MFERLLLAIIEAHTTPETNGQQRLRMEAALAALLGPVTPTERELDRALQFMASERRQDACYAEIAALVSPCATTAKPMRSIPQLAEAAAREVMGCIAPKEIQAIARRLCDLYRTRGNAHAMASDPIEEALKTEAVERLCAELAEWGVPTWL
ncbi:hypothetical protein HPQ64_04260 [Rhizobiales bacterium]|uniref:hypothetical protein n=1 Tax=Hongsoonwoonella zoysiae TaxID=2821844 RepID=UPI00155F932A|nr:hypothetical protein [Hongsoonwoonella zoysiae]NRG16900.1 hypothetical protein [Hongsoonwoonella zoysiae]